MDENKRVVEINGIKLEVDMRYAKRIDEFKVGDTVKVLDNRYDKHELRTGVITDFANFKELPTLMVAIYKAATYWSESPSIEFIPYNAETKDIEIVGVSAEEIIVSKETIVDKFNDDIAKQRDRLNDLIVKRDTFIKYFGGGQNGC